MDEKIYWIWLQQSLKYGAHKVKEIKNFFASIKDFFEAGEREWRLCGIFNNHEINGLCSISLKTAYDILEKCERLSYQILTFGDPTYPKLLSNISNPPSVIYASGDVSCLNKLMTISVVGTRQASMYGICMADEVGYRLAQNGVVVVSGAAMGIDSAAHRGALRAKGKTVAVLGCGINYNYLVRNSDLRRKISESGVVISEYPPDYSAFSTNFPMRNRIISGLSLGTIIIEAGKKSGSLITANLANEQGRDVFVVPVDMRSKLSEGSMSLIEDGAEVIEDIESVINEYKNRYKYKKVITSEDKITRQILKPRYTNERKNKLEFKKENNSILKTELPELTDPARKIYEVLCKGKMNVNDISYQSQLEISKLLAALTELEIYGLVKVHSGRMYEINKDYR